MAAKTTVPPTDAAVRPAPTPSTRSDRPARGSARERILAAANELFYEEGIHNVGVDRVIEHAGVAKASLYNTFGSKDELVRAYLMGRQASREERITRGIARHDTPREKLLGVYDVLGERFAEPAFRGCAFINASGEARRGSATEQVREYARGWVRSLFVDLARQTGAADPEALGAQLVLLYDGALVGAQVDSDPSIAATARAAAAMLIDLATGSAVAAS
jgi:AcrR family transcriptional regulator